MEWLSYLLILLCPLMMVFCMIGHGKGHRQQEDSDTRNLDKQVKHLQEENNILRDKVEYLTELVKK